MMHKTLGYGGLIMAWANIFISFTLSTVLQSNFITQQNTLQGLFYAGLGTFVAVGLILHVRDWRRRTAVAETARPSSPEGTYEDDKLLEPSL
mmetsp:Transcript_1018/g.3435  ORF Transcript_1018/g.3435 Transcript_1018/m.3435 type:complete len:92 (-) Transcript_1018:222-497(-)